MVVVVVVRTPTPNYLRQASQNLGKYPRYKGVYIRSTQRQRVLFTKVFSRLYSLKLL